MTNHAEQSAEYLKDATDASERRFLPEIINSFALLSIAHGIQALLERENILDAEVMKNAVFLKEKPEPLLGQTVKGRKPSPQVKKAVQKLPVDSVTSQYLNDASAEPDQGDGGVR